MVNSNITNITQKIVGVSLNKNKNVSIEEVIKVTDVPLIDDAPARMVTLKAEDKKWYLTVVYLPNTEIPFAFFCQTNNIEKSATTHDAIDRLIALARRKGILDVHIDKVIEKSMEESNVTKLTRTISLLLRHGVLIKNIVAVLDTIDNIYVGTFLFQIKKFLSQYIQNGEVVQDERCDKCQGTLVYSEGCMTCRDCGHSKCG